MSDTHEPRQCFVILPDQFQPELGYVPSLVVENEAGHTPMAGRGELSTPWYWGTDFDVAKAICDRANEDSFGLTTSTAAEIVASSIAAQISGDSATERRRVDLVRKLGRNPYAV